eukprot:701372-Amphidinium_carterae.2
MTLRLKTSNFLDRINDAAIEDSQRRRLDDSIIFTSTLRSLSEPGCRSSDTSDSDEEYLV